MEQTNRNANMTRRVLILAAALMVVCLLVSVGLIVAFMPAISSQIETLKAEGAAAVATQPAAATSSGGNLPGLTPKEVTRYLEENQFDCQDTVASPDYYFWKCERKSADAVFEITLFSYDNKEALDLMDGNVNQPGEPSDEKAAALLGFMAAIANPQTAQEARQWIDETLPTLRQAGDVRTRTIGGLQYQLYGPKEARSLEIGSLP
jgi:competence protein ComGC